MDEEEESQHMRSRSPYGERGLKSLDFWRSNRTRGRSPYGRAWIEIRTRLWRFPAPVCRSPYGERGLKSERSHSLPVGMRRSPYGERGLKYAVGVRHGRRPGRSPYGERGLKSCCGRGLLDVQASLSLRRAWIEISNPRPWNGRHESLSLRRAWIEISTRPSPASA